MKTRGIHAEMFRSLAMLLTGWLLLLTRAWAATIVSGNVYGTWTTNGSPYILSADCIIGPIQTLTIQPGVTVIIAPAVRINVYGGIFATGTPAQPITIRGTSPTNYWESIWMRYGGFTNRFRFCRFSDANSPALEFDVEGNNTMRGEVIHCEFSNCRNGAVFGGVNPNGPISGGATMALEVHNSVFDSTSYGCFFIVDSGAVDSKISGNIFRNLNHRAFYLQGTGGFSEPAFVNNTVANVNQGVEVYGQFAPVIRNNLFFRNTNALTGAATNAAFNCFYQNTANFVGYPFLYGFPIQNNHNGDPCDAFFNIFLNPQFLDTNQFLLANTSPCIDAGDPAIADVCFQFSHGSTISDIGAYGGPDACGWLTNGSAPVVTSAPSDQSSCVGGSATFKVRVEGSEPLSYRWFFNGTTLLAGKTNAQLDLLNLQTQQAGLYSVVVANMFGSATSVPVRLVVSDACVGINLYAGLSITGIVGRTYSVDYVTNLAATNWTTLALNTFTTPQWLFIDTNTPVDVKKFFRVRLLP